MYILSPSPSPKDDDESNVWVEHTSSSGRVYYYNKKNGVSQWERPTCMAKRLAIGDVCLSLCVLEPISLAPPFPLPHSSLPPLSFPFPFCLLHRLFFLFSPPPFLHLTSERRLKALPQNTCHILHQSPLPPPNTPPTLTVAPPTLTVAPPTLTVAPPTLTLHLRTHTHTAARTLVTGVTHLIITRHTHYITPVTRHIITTE